VGSSASWAVTVTVYGLPLEAVALMVPEMVPLAGLMLSPAGSPVAVKLFAGSALVMDRDTTSPSLFLRLPGLDRVRVGASVMAKGVAGLETPPSVVVAVTVTVPSSPTAEAGTVTVIWVPVLLVGIRVRLPNRTVEPGPKPAPVTVSVNDP